MKPTGPEMNIGNAGRRPKLKPWVVVLKWTECPDGSYVSHDYRWRIRGLEGEPALFGLSASLYPWDGPPREELAWACSTVPALMRHAQDYSDGFRKHVWESIHGPYQARPAR